MTIRFKHLCCLFCLLIPCGVAWAECPSFLKHEMRQLHSDKMINLCDVVQNKPALIVNTASHCGFTPQYAGLQKLHEEYASQGLVVIGFASNSFFQESKDEAESAQICRKNFGVTFTMLASTKIKGANANPVFAELNRQAGAPSWNFYKYLVAPDGQVLKRFPALVAPDAQALKQAIEAVLK